MLHELRKRSQVGRAGGTVPVRRLCDSRPDRNLFRDPAERRPTVRRTRDPADRQPSPTERSWQDETRPLPERVELLLAAMTLEEKVGQLGSRWVGNNLAGEPGVEGSDLQVAPMQDVFAASGTVPLAEASRHGLGHLTRVYGSEPVTVTEGPTSWSTSNASSWSPPGSTSPPSCTRSA